MDAGSLPIVAAAPGEVIAVADGNYDRCHADLSSGAVSCDGHPMKSNHVKVKHADGFVTAYHHMLKGSVLPKVGDVVACGQALGLVGSSGNSAMPHLHFEVMRPDGSVVDPYAGACSQPESWWVVQDGPYGLPGPWCEGEPIPEWGEAPAAEDVPEEVAAVESAPEEPAVEEPAAEEPAIEEPAVAEEVVVSDEPMLDAFGPDGGAGEPAVVSARQVGCTTGGRTTPAAVGWLLLAVLVALRVATSGPRTWRSRPRGWPAPGRGDRTPSRS
jgi:murein DD-endopeptidase MepM/ murein hydrolase activator NlpD